MNTHRTIGRVGLHGACVFARVVRIPGTLACPGRSR